MCSVFSKLGVVSTKYLWNVNYVASVLTGKLYCIHDLAFVYEATTVFQFPRRQKELVFLQTNTLKMKKNDHYTSQCLIFSCIFCSDQIDCRDTYHM